MNIMEDLEIIYLDLKDIKPYKRNAKKHPESQIDQICQSIESFGMNDPIAVAGDDNEIVEGHGRYLACKKLNLSTVPVIRLDHLTEEQRKAYNLVHNKLCMNSDFDLKILSKELDDIFNIDMSAFGFDVEDIHDEWDASHDDNKYNEQFIDQNVLNVERALFDGVGPYDIPQLKPTTEIPEIDEWIGFNYVLSEKNPERKAVHFFLNDYQFERIWNNPGQYAEKLSKFACVAAPDFSIYDYMPMALKIYNHYRKMWVARFLQEAGVCVIPTFRTTVVESNFDDICCDGMPENSAIIISTVYTNTEDKESVFRRAYDIMSKRLKPSKVYIYGNLYDNLGGNIENIKTFAENRFKKGK